MNPIFQSLPFAGGMLIFSDSFSKTRRNSMLDKRSELPNLLLDRRSALLNLVLDTRLEFEFKRGSVNGDVLARDLLVRADSTSFSSSSRRTMVSYVLEHLRKELPV